MNKMIIYKTTNIINNKIYIGFDTKNNINYYGSGKIIRLAIKKYGKNNFKKEILEYCNSIEILHKQEKFWIKKLKSQDKNIGYNIMPGGNGGIIWKGNPPNYNKKFSIEHKNKISNSLKNRIFSKTHKKNISLNHTNVSGKNNPMYGKHHSIETKNKQRKLMLGKKLSDFTKQKMSQKKKGELNNNSKLVEQEVLKIREEYFKYNKTLTNLALNFNVQKACIFKIINFKTWKHL